MALSEANIYLFRLINDLGKQYPHFNSSFVFIAEYMVYFLALSVIYFWFRRNEHSRIMVICAGSTFIVSEMIGKIAGKIHSNYQPFAELPNVNQLIEKAVDNSFPSDHTILFFSFCMTFWLFKKGSGLLWLLLAIIVGISRIWVGVHYPADVIVGAVISIFSAIVVYFTLPKLTFINHALELYEKIERYVSRPKIKTKDF
ncbi:Undecaprenyl-diphosphatase [Schinkia azotoformans MEV2011]|uniref:Undecaprenyl-diphosphatase n=1 Tax=Schinkia azotoformans MEV2011 TaxID=1348973 RepID=A0A072NJM1_SCHAZ|nr:undecaprenyl-diphosphatase [Schinkia azotoformans]KEF37904.1 Undecaprenyl-diphosphatase [Schinkia azotoformans MEV2011]MEC1696586.1 undecaprenyl-diphosphatase [Schinkia azotoformans]MEC1716035.1 undecaprenyl-diphosphatase [Schinkia azotoformans]MEC1725923.1 undecaprenyl-diphosphatase [Schinkia azotoformans]MEC1740506.1 undecaprenyl-diphosphatase [Schinkia azotoformans]